MRFARKRAFRYAWEETYVKKKEVGVIEKLLEEATAEPQFTLNPKRRL